MKHIHLTALALVVALTAAPAAVADDPTKGGSGDATTGGSSPATATASHHTRIVVVRMGDWGPAVTKIQRRLRIPADGIFGSQTNRAVRRFQRRKRLEVDGIVGPITRRALRLRPFRRSEVRHRARSRRTSSRLPRVLQQIALCESGGNPRAVSRDGRYRGKFQFSIPTWRSVGGRGDPARAAESVQDRLAVRLYRKRGLRPWPACARAIRRR